MRFPAAFSPLTRAFLQLHTAIILAGFTGVLGRFIQLNEGVLVWYRMVLALVVLAILARLGKQSLRLSGKYLWYCVATGGVIALHWLFFYGSIKYGNVSIALVCFAATGSFTALLEPWLLRRRPDPYELLLGLLVLLGIYLMFRVETAYKTAILLGFVAAFLSALFPIFNKKLVQHVAAPVLTFYEMAGGVVLLTLLLPLYLQVSPADRLIPSAGDWLGLLVLVVFCTVLAFQLSVLALKKISPFTANLSYNLEPLYGILLAFLFFGEQKEVGAGFWWGVTLILVSVLIQTGRMWRRQLR